jgi:hypothetical protein
LGTSRFEQHLGFRLCRLGVSKCRGRADTHAYCDGNSECDTNAHAYCHCNTDGNGNTHINSDCDGNANGNTDWNSKFDADSDA